jgi:hypothetical protein
MKRYACILASPLPPFAPSAEPAGSPFYPPQVRPHFLGAQQSDGAPLPFSGNCSPTRRTSPRRGDRFLVVATLALPTSSSGLAAPLGRGDREAIEALVRGGKGFVTIHGASYHFSGLDVITDGHLPVGWKEPAWPPAGCSGRVSCPPKRYHGPRHTTVKVTDATHPIAAGPPPTWPPTNSTTAWRSSGSPSSFRLQRARGGAVRERFTDAVATESAPGAVSTPSPARDVGDVGPGSATFLRWDRMAATGKVTPARRRLAQTTRRHPARPRRNRRTLRHVVLCRLREPACVLAPRALEPDAFRNDLRGRRMSSFFDMSRTRCRGRTNLEALRELARPVVMHHATADYPAGVVAG